MQQKVFVAEKEVAKRERKKEKLAELQLLTGVKLNRMNLSSIVGTEHQVLNLVTLHCWAQKNIKSVKTQPNLLPTAHPIMAVYMTRVSWELFEIMVLIKAGSVGLVVQFLAIETEVVGSNPGVLPCKISFIMLMSV